MFWPPKPKPKATVTPIYPWWVIANRETGYQTGKPVTLDRATEGARLMNRSLGTDSFRAVPYRGGLNPEPTKPRAA